MLHRRSKHILWAPVQHKLNDIRVTKYITMIHIDHFYKTKAVTCPSRVQPVCLLSTNYEFNHSIGDNLKCSVNQNLALKWLRLTLRRQPRSK